MYMSTSQNESRDEPPKSEKPTPAILMLATMADTTWRLFVPSVGLLLVGVYLDKIWETKPWLMIVGLVLGTAIAIILLRAQLKKNLN